MFQESIQSKYINFNLSLQQNNFSCLQIEYFHPFIRISLAHAAILAAKTFSHRKQAPFGFHSSEAMCNNCVIAVFYAKS